MSVFSRQKSQASKRFSAYTTARRSWLRQPRQGRSVVVLMLLLLLWSLCLGWGLAQATEPRSPAASAQTPSAQTPPPTPTETKPISAEGQAAIGTVDVVPPRLQRGQAIYLGTCATCHFGLPPAIMPTQTWQQLLQDPQHYGATLTPLVNPNLKNVWDYMRAYSRPLTEEEEVPYRIYQSRFFKALHPRVKLPPRAGMGSCISCHPGTQQYDFRSLSAEWQNAP